jgi:pyruvate carboxylase
VLKAADAGVHVADGAISAMSGTTSQPNLNSIVAALAHTERDTGLSFDVLTKCSDYWEVVRTYYTPFDNAPKSGSADVYIHEMPGGQFTNLKEQAEAMGLGDRWPEVARMYADVNFAFGDIVKVTPSSKVIGDLALFLLSHGITIEEFKKLPADHKLSLPNSVIDMLQGSLGQPEGGWPPRITEIVLRGKSPETGRPGEKLAPADLDKAAAAIAEQYGTTSRTDLMSYLMYPDVFGKFASTRTEYGDLEVLPTPQFFYGMSGRDEITVDLEPGKAIIIRLLTVDEPRPDGMRSVFFELNGQPREIEIRDKAFKEVDSSQRKANPANSGEVAAPIPGAVTTIHVKVDTPVRKGDGLLVMEAMKMQTTVYAPKDGVIRELAVKSGDSVKAGDLLLILE